MQKGQTSRHSYRKTLMESHQQFGNLGYLFVYYTMQDKETGLLNTSEQGAGFLMHSWMRGQAS